jgi:hypothetical protein
MSYETIQNTENETQSTKRILGKCLKCNKTIEHKSIEEALEGCPHCNETLNKLSKESDIAALKFRIQRLEEQNNLYQNDLNTLNIVSGAVWELLAILSDKPDFFTEEELGKLEQYGKMYMVLNTLINLKKKLSQKRNKKEEEFDENKKEEEFDENKKEEEFDENKKTESQ